MPRRWERLGGFSNYLDITRRKDLQMLHSRITNQFQSPKLPRGKDRISKGLNGYNRMKLGAGEHATVYRMLSGPFRGLVCRIPIDKPSGLNSEKTALLRFRRHQIWEHLSALQKQRLLLV